MPSELFEKKLREKLSQATIPPTPELWNNIESELNRGGSKRGIGFWILLALLLFASMGALWGFWHMNESTDGQAQTNIVQREVLAAPITPSPKINESPTAESSKDELEGLPIIDQSSTAHFDTKSTELKRIHTQTTENTRSNKAEINKQTSITRNQQTSYDQQTTSSDPKTYSSAVLSKDISEGISSQVPQHTNQALQESHILSEASSISSKEEIVEVAGLQKGLSLPLTSTLDPVGIDLRFPKQKFKKEWAFLVYMDSHNDLREVSINNFIPDKNAEAPLAFEEDFRVLNINDLADPYSYAGLNTPGNLSVYAPSKSLSFGLQAEWKFHPKFSLQSGWEYGFFSLGSYAVRIVADNTASTPEYLGNSVSRRSALFTSHQLGIPVQLNYQLFTKGRSSVNLYGGGSFYAARAYSKSILQSANFYDFADVESGADGTVNSRTAVARDVPSLIQLNSFNVTAHAGFDYFYHLSDKSSLFVGPQIKYQATPIYREQQAEINEVPFYLGLRLGFRFAK